MSATSVSNLFFPSSATCIAAHICHVNHFHTYGLQCVSACVCVRAAAGMCACAFPPPLICALDDDLMCRVSFTPVLARDTVKLIEPKH